MCGLGLNQLLNRLKQTAITKQKLPTEHFDPSNISNIVLLHMFYPYLIPIYIIKLSWVLFFWGSCMKVVPVS